jgi:hypothetical protein
MTRPLGGWGHPPLLHNAARRATLKPRHARPRSVTHFSSFKARNWPYQANPIDSPPRNRHHKRHDASRRKRGTMRTCLVALVVSLLAVGAEGIRPVQSITNAATAGTNAAVKVPVEPDATVSSGITLSTFTNALVQKGITVGDVTSLKCHFLAGCLGYHQIHLNSPAEYLEVYDFATGRAARLAFPGGIYTNSFGVVIKVETKGDLDLVVNERHSQWRQIHEVWSHLGEPPKPLEKPVEKK